MQIVRLLTFATLFPNAEQPNHGVFVENRLRHLVADGSVTSEVLAPVPFFPSRSARFGTWSRYARVPRVEKRHGLRIHHPRYPVIPKVGMTLAPILLYQASVRAIERLCRGGFAFDAIDAHYLYPDGVAAVRLGQRFGKPVVITARGSDVTQIATFPRPCAMIKQAIRMAAALITVSASLREGLIELGAAPEHVTVLRNGVDTELFRPVDREPARRSLQLTRKTIISVGLLIERKRHHLTIEAMRLLPDCELIIVGEGPERARLAGLISAFGVGDRVRLLGAHPHADLPRFYSAADVIVLASSREGWANVLLEAMACGTPAVAMRIGGNAEVIRAPEAGCIVDDPTPEALAAAIRSVLNRPADRAHTRAYAEAFGWEETTSGQIALFRDAVARGARTPFASLAV